MTWKSGLVLLLAMPVLLAGCAHRQACGDSPEDPNRLYSDELSIHLSVTDADEAVFSDGSEAALKIPGGFDYHRCRADQGDQISQYVVGYAYEYGKGVPVNLKQAEKYYRQAASRRSNKTYVYSPPVGSEGSGRVVPVTLGPDTPGLKAAESALDRLRKRESSSASGH